MNLMGLALPELPPVLYVSFPTVLLFTAVSRCVAVMHWLSGLCCGLYSLTVLHTLKWKNVSTQAQKLVYPDVTHVRDIPGSASVFMGFKGHTLNEKH